MRSLRDANFSSSCPGNRHALHSDRLPNTEPRALNTLGSFSKIALARQVITLRTRPCVHNTNLFSY